MRFFEGFEKRAEKVRGGLADGEPDSKYPEDQIKKGVKVEMEHTKDPALAKEITKDHLEESKEYYTHLEKMEKDMDKKGGDEPKKTQKNKAIESDPYSGHSHILAEPETEREWW